MKVPEFTQFRESLQRAFGTRLAEDLPARVGNPVDHAILVDNTDRDGLVYIHGLGSDPQSAYTAINNLGKDALTYDAPVLVRRVVNGYIITSKDLEMWDRFWAGTVLHDQQPVLLSQIMYGTAQPTNPASMQVMLLGAIYDVDDVGYRGSDQLSADFSTSPVDVDTVAIDIPTAPLTAIGICIQIDPTTDTLSYKQGAAFPATLTHKQAFDAGYYPQRDTDQRRITWLRLVTGMTAISYEHLYNAPELLNSGGGSLPVHTHQDDDNGGTLDAAAIAAGTLKHERGGLEADVSAYDGYIKISGGATSAVTTIPLAFNHRIGLVLSRLSDTELMVNTGSVMVGTALQEKQTSTYIDITTAANWIGGSSLETASSWVNVYINASGNILLHDTLPVYPVADTASRVADMQVNEAGWDGTAGQGLNATTITYDNDTGEGNITAGMYVIVASDAGCTTGRGKGSGAAASKNDLSFALITAVDTGANTITVEAGHQIAINDDDYLFVVEAGAPIFNYISSTWYRYLGSLWNNSSSNLTDNSNQRSQYTLNEGSDYTTTSAVFTPVDSTNLNLNLILTGNEVDIRAEALGIANVTSAKITYFDFYADGVALAGDDGIAYGQHNYSSIFFNRTFSVAWSALLLPGTHNFTLYWKNNGGTSELYAGAGTSGRDIHTQFIAREVNK